MATGFLSASVKKRVPIVLALGFEADRDEIGAGEMAGITVSGFDADNDPITYVWSTTAGRITGSGERVSFDSTGLTPGTYVVQVTATDGRNGVATSQIEITVR